MSWDGDVAARLLKTKPLADRRLSQGTYRIEKGDVRALALAAAALEVRSGPGGDATPVDLEIRATEAVWRRLQELRIRIPPFHGRVARQLFRYPNVHFSEADAVCLLKLQFTCVSSDALRSCLDDLVQWRVIQQIKVEDCRFFDIDNTPHLHIYNTRTRELSDAPSAGIVRID
ncbi:MAG: hypothetical protein AAF417_16790 [Pseudomonadota bacterium]